jgi:hypothetical protein
MTFDIKKFTDHIHGASTLKPAERSQLADAISAAAPHMQIADLRVLNKALSDLIQGDAEKHSKKAVRLRKLQAALENQSADPVVDSQIRLVRGSLRTLGYGDLNEHTKNGLDPLELHKRAKAAGWQPERILNLKIQAERIGLLD